MVLKDENMDLAKKKSNEGHLEQTGIPEKIEKDATRERVDLSLEMTEKEKPKSKTVLELLASIEARKDLGEQKELIKAMENVLEQLLCKAMAMGIKVEDIEQNPLLIKRFAGNETEIAALGKLEEILKYSREYQRSWVPFCKEAEKVFKKNAKAKTALENGKPPAGHEWMGTAVRVGLIAAGAYGAYELYQWYKHKNDNDVSEGDKKFPYLDAALTTMGVGALIGPNHLLDWSEKYMGLEFTSDSLKNFWDNLKKWKIGEAFSSLLFKTSHPGINKAAEKLEIDRSQLIDLKDVSYKEFKKFRSDPKSKTMSFAGEAAKFLGIDLSSNIIGTNVDDKIRAAEGEEKLYKFIEVNKSGLSGKDVETMSIGEILNEYEKQGILEGKGGNNSEKAEGKIEKGTLETMGGHFPHARATYEAWKNDEIDTDEAIAEVVKGTIDDGGGLLVNDGGLWLVKKTAQGLVFAFIGSFQIIKDTVVDTIGMFRGKKGLSDMAIDYYEDGGLWFAGAGALIGFVRTQTLKGATFGALEGIKTSYLFAPKCVKWGKEGSDMAKHGSYTLREFTAATEEEKIAILHAKATYHAAEFKKYSEAFNREQSGDITKGVKEKWLNRLFPGWTKEEMIKHGKFFNEARNDFIKRTRVENDLKITNEEIIGSEQSRTKLLREAENFTSKYPESTLPKIPVVRTATPKFKTLKEANEGELAKLKLNINQIDRLKKLGFDEKAAVRMRELKLSGDELDTLLSKMEGDPKLLNGFELLVSNERYPQLFNALRAAKKFAVPIALILTVYEFDRCKDKTDFIMKDAGMLAVFAGAFKVSEMTVGSKLPPIWGIPVSALLATGVAFGGDKLWDKFANPMLEKYAPNRDNFWGNTAAGKTIADAIDFLNPMSESKTGLMRSKFAEYNITGGVDENTDPLKYMVETARAMDPLGNILAGNDFSIFRDIKLHTYKQLVENAKKTLEKRISELAEVKGQNAEREAELNLAIPKLQSMVDGSWLNERKTALVLTKGLQLDPAYDEFKGMVMAKFGDKALLTYLNLMTGVMAGKRNIENDEMKNMWEYLYAQKVTINGKIIGFPEFLALSSYVAKEAAGISIVEHELQGNTNV